METVLLLHSFPSWSKHGTASKVLERDWAAWVRVPWCYSAHIKRSQQGIKRTASFPLSNLRGKKLWERNNVAAAQITIFSMGKLMGLRPKTTLLQKKSQSSRQLIIFLLFVRKACELLEKPQHIPGQLCSLTANCWILQPRSQTVSGLFRYVQRQTETRHLHRELI